jgi:RimJ/RimL family protein N-acetyltransferase
LGEGRAVNLDVVFDTYPQLETERLLLRELRSGDAESLFAVLGDEAVAEFYDDEVFRHVSQASEQIEVWAAWIQGETMRALGDRSTEEW